MASWANWGKCSQVAVSKNPAVWYSIVSASVPWLSTSGELVRETVENLHHMYCSITKRHPIQLIRVRMTLTLGTETPESVWLTTELIDKWASDLRIQHAQLNDRLWGSEMAPSVVKEHAPDVPLNKIMMQLGLAMEFSMSIDINPLSSMRELFPQFQWDYCHFDERAKIGKHLKQPHRMFEVRSGYVFATGPLMQGKYAFKCGASDLNRAMDVLLGEKGVVREVEPIVIEKK